MEYIIVALLAIVLIIQVVILVKAAAKKEDKTEAVLEFMKDMQKDQSTLKIDVIKEISEGSAKNQDTIRRSLMEMQESTEKRFLANSKNVNDSIVGGLKSIQEANDRKLSDIQRNMDEKVFIFSLLMKSSVIGTICSCLTQPWSPNLIQP